MVMVPAFPDAVAGTTHVVVMPDDPGNPYWNASCSSTPGCTDPTACNFSYLATEDDGTCGITDDCEECQQPFCSDPVSQQATCGAEADCGQIWVGIQNLSNPMMNASCEVLCCMYPTACNCVPHAQRNDLSCEWSSCIVQGCTCPSAENFSPLAEQDNGTYSFESTCVGDVDSDGAVTASDLPAFI